MSNLLVTTRPWPNRMGSYLVTFVLIGRTHRNFKQKILVLELLLQVCHWSATKIPICLISTTFCILFHLFSSFMRTHAHAMNDYRWGEMSTEVVVDQNLWTEIVDRKRK